MNLSLGTLFPISISKLLGASVALQSCVFVKTITRTSVLVTEECSNYRGLSVEDVCLCSPSMLWNFVQHLDCGFTEPN